MPLLVFFLSHVDESRDKVLKLAPLRQLLSKVNPKTAGRAAPRVYFDRAIWTRLRVRRAYLCQQLSHVHACTWMFVGTNIKERIKSHAKSMATGFCVGLLLESIP